MIKHQPVRPATPLPWNAWVEEEGEGPEFENHNISGYGDAFICELGSDEPKVDAAYIAHACNAYPKLVAELEMAFSRLADKAAREEIAALLLELGEKQ
jgi:hypothetical protein